MASLGQAKILGGIGSILTLLTVLPVPYAGGVLSLVGWILILVAVKQISDALGDSKIFNDMLIAAVLLIIGIIVAVVVVVAAVFQFIGLGTTITPGSPPPADFIALLGSILIGLVVAWVFFLVSSIFIRRSYSAISLKTHVGMFNTTGLLFLIGAATTIVLVGIFIIFIAEILQAIAFFSLPEQLQPPAYQPGYYTPPTPPPPAPQTP